MGDIGQLGGMDVDMSDVGNSLVGASSNGQASYSLATSETSETREESGNMNSGVGAGPLPTGWGQSIPQTGSTLTDFTKRRNWSKLVLEQLRDLYFVLSPELRLLYISASSVTLTGYSPLELKSKFLSDFVHQDDRGMVIREINEAIASQQQLRFFYRFRGKDDTYSIFEGFGHPHYTTDHRMSGPIDPSVRPCGGLFFMSRPYPTKNAHLLDSFLEHKIEHERLLRKIADLKREEKEEIEQQDHMIARREAQSSIASLEQAAEAQTDTTSLYDGMPPPPRPSATNVALTKQNLSEALAAAKPDSINDKMARYEGATPMEHVEMLTGLRHGERSEGISTGAMSPALIKGDAGITILADREIRAPSEKKKKLKMADEYVCTDCGTLDSPEWRKGPQGPKTLCNACGLRWAKKEKKRQGSMSGPSIGHSTSTKPTSQAT